MAIRTKLAWIAIMTGVLAPPCWSQDPGQGQPEAMNSGIAKSGINFTGVSVFSGFSTSSSNLTGGQLLTSGLTGSGALFTYGVSTGLQWQRTRRKVDFSLRFSASYAGISESSNLNSLNGTLDFTTSRTWGKWSASIGGFVSDISAAEYPFQTSGLGGISQTPANFNDLAAAFSVGQFSSPQAAASLATTNPDLQPNSYLFGGRVLSYFVTPTLTYVRSSRWQFHFASGSAFGQSRSGVQNVTAPRGINLGGGVSTSYSLSPRTQLGFGVEEQSVFNRYQKTYGTIATVSLGRKMGQHWLLRGHAGTVFGVFASQTSGTSKTPPIVGGGSLAFQLQNQTFVGSYNRSAFDSYGYGAGTSTSASAAWSWHRPRAWWKMTAQAGQHQTRDTGFASLSGWQASAGLSGRLKDHIVLNASYAYFKSTGTYAGIFNSYSLNGIRVSLGWAPQAAQPARP